MNCSLSNRQMKNKIFYLQPQLYGWRYFYVALHFLWSHLSFLLSFHFSAYKNSSQKKHRENHTCKNPHFRLSPKALDTAPTTVGPPEHPRSPPRARNANMAVPPFGIAAAALLKLPGHIIPTERPHTAQAARLNCGMGRREIPRYDRIHRQQL